MGLGNGCGMSQYTVLAATPYLVGRAEVLPTFQMGKQSLRHSLRVPCPAWARFLNFSTFDIWGPVVVCHGGLSRALEAVRQYHWPLPPRCQ